MHPFAFAGISCCVFLFACSTPAPPNEVSQAPLPLQDTIVQQGGNALDLLLPTHIRNVWELPSPERWDDYWEKEYADSTGTLGHRHADLDGDGTLDHAFLLSRKDTARRDSAYALVIRFGNYKDTLLSVEPWAEADGHIGMGLTLEPPGLLGHLGGEEGGEPEGSVELKQPAVTLVYFEKASITWYWKDGSFHKVWTGD